MSSQRSSRLQLPKKPKCVSAPARTSTKDQEQVDEAVKQSLQTPAATVGAARHVDEAGDPLPRTSGSTDRRSNRKVAVASKGAPADCKDEEKEEGSPDSFAVHLDQSPPSHPARSERARTASRKRQLLVDSEDDQEGEASSGSEQSAAGESGGDSGSDFSGAESESSEDADSDVADSEDEEEEKAPAKKPRQVKAKAAAKQPKGAQQKKSAAAAPANCSSAAARKAQASAPVARSGPAAKAQQPVPTGAARKGYAAQASGAQVEMRQPLQPRGDLNTASATAAAPTKGLFHSKGIATAAPAAAAAAVPVPAAKSGSEQTPVLKHIRPGASLAAILSGGPVYRVAGLRRAGGAQLHNIGPKQG